MDFPALCRLTLAACFAAALGAAAPAVEEWVPLRWEGGPLEVHRRAQPEFEALSPIAAEQLLAAYEPAALSLLDETPFNCLLLTWSAGTAGAPGVADHRVLAAAFAKQAQQRGIAAVAVVEPGPDWLDAVREAGSAGFGGVALDGAFTAEQVEHASGVLPAEAVVIALIAWRQALALEQPPIVASGDGVWPALLTAEDESDSFESGPTSDPWVVANSWRIAALRAGSDGRAVWSGHRPQRYRDQPFAAEDYLRAIADTAMAGGLWAVVLDGDWQAGLLAGDEEKREGWKRIAAAVAFFEQQAAWRELPPSSAVVAVLDPETLDVFSDGETLNLLAVRHVPHRVVLRGDLPGGGLPEGVGGVTFDFAPKPEEVDLLRAFAASGGAVFTGPNWAAAEVEIGLPVAALGAGGRMAYPEEAFEEDKFATDLRQRLDENGSTIRIFNTGTLMSYYAELGRRGVLHLTEYSDYPTDNVTVRFPRKIEKATWTTLDGYEQELEVYDTVGGGEIVIPEVPVYCAVTLEFVAR